MWARGLYYGSCFTFLAAALLVGVSLRDAAAEEKMRKAFSSVRGVAKGLKRLSIIGTGAAVAVDDGGAPTPAEQEIAADGGGGGGGGGYGGGGGSGEVPAKAAADVTRELSAMSAADRAACMAAMQDGADA